MNDKDKLTDLYRRLERTRSLLRNGKWYDADKSLQGATDLLKVIIEENREVEISNENS
jgi:hypothetical protein